MKLINTIIRSHYLSIFVLLIIIARSPISEQECIKKITRLFIIHYFLEIMQRPKVVLNAAECRLLGSSTFCATKINI